MLLCLTNTFAAALLRKGLLLRPATVLLAAASREYVESPRRFAAPRCWSPGGSLLEVLPIIITIDAETRSHTRGMREVWVLKGRFDAIHTGTLLL